MDNTILYTFLSVLAVSLVSLLGLLTISFHSRWGKKVLTFLVSFAAGALLGDVFIHLLPELVEEGQFDLRTSLYILGGIAAFFFIEKFLHWHHHFDEDEQNHTHPFVIMNLVGDGVHNLIDGMIIASAYMIDINLGIATTVAVILHEIPQEIADFGVLVYGGFSKAKALMYNVLSGLTAVVGAVIVLAIGTTEAFTSAMVALAIGIFIYIATADLIPQIHKEREKFLSQFFSFLLGIAVMFMLLYLE